MSFILGTQTPFDCQNVSTCSTLILYKYAGTHIFSVKQLYLSLVISRLGFERGFGFCLLQFLLIA